MRGRLRSTSTPFGGHNLLGPTGARPPIAANAPTSNTPNGPGGPIPFSEKLILPNQQQHQQQQQPHHQPNPNSNNTSTATHPESSDAITLLHLSQQTDQHNNTNSSGNPPHAQIQNMIMQRQQHDPQQQQHPPQPQPQRHQPFDIRVLEVDFNAGVQLRKHILSRLGGGREMALDLGRFFRGDCVYLERCNPEMDAVSKKRKSMDDSAPASRSSPHSPPPIAGKIERCSGKDATILSSWYRIQGDKHLPYSTTSWSEWWERRCSLIDPGCEMIKLLLPNPFTKQWDVAGVAYYERNVADVHLYEGRRVRVTLVRGIRVAPGVNGEVLRRRKWGEVEETEYRGIASVLLCHVVMRSLLCGTEGIAVNCIKSDVAEKFYARYMGDPIAVGEEDGRKYFRICGDKRWGIIKGQFMRQCRMLGHEVKLGNEDEGGGGKEGGDKIRIKAESSETSGNDVKAERGDGSTGDGEHKETTNDQKKTNTDGIIQKQTALTAESTPVSSVNDSSANAEGPSPSISKDGSSNLPTSNNSSSSPRLLSVA